MLYCLKNGKRIARPEIPRDIKVRRQFACKCSSKIWPILRMERLVEYNIVFLVLQITEVAEKQYT